MPRTSTAPASLHGSYFAIDDALRVTQWPQDTAAALGVPAHDAVGKFCWQLVHPESQRMPAACRRFCPARRVEAQPPGLSSAPSDGRRCAALPLPGSRAGALVWTAVAGKTPAAQPFEDLLIRGCLSAQPEGLDDTLDLVRRFCGADDCEMFLRDPRRPEVVLAGCAGHDRDAFRELTRIPMGSGYPGGVTARQQPMYTNDFQNDRVFLRARVRDRGIHAFLGIPLADGDATLGYLGVGWRDPAIAMHPLISRLERVLPLFLDRILREYYRRPVLDEALAPLSIRCFGGLEVSRDGERLAASAFKRRPALTLLKLLLLHAPRPLHRDVLAEALWPDAAPHAARNRLHGVVHALRSAIGEAYVRNEGDFYAFDTALPHFVDLLAFRKLAVQPAAAATRGEDARLYIWRLESAVALYRGGLFAGDPDGERFDDFSLRVARQYQQAVAQLAQAYLAETRAADAARLLEAALALTAPTEPLRRLLAEAAASRQSAFRA